MAPRYCSGVTAMDNYRKCYLHLSIDDGLFIGMSTKMCLQKLLREGDNSPRDVTKFYQSTRAFHVRALQYALDNLPVHDALLRNATFLDFRSREHITFSQVEYFVERYCNKLC